MRKPDFKLKVLHKETKQSSSRVGVGWLNEDGSVSIKLDIGVVLDWRMSLDCAITLFKDDKSS